MTARFHRVCMVGSILGFYAFAEAAAEDVQLQGREERALPCVPALETGASASEQVCVLALRPVGSDKRPAALVQPLNAQAPSLKLGGYNQAALRQQYGSNFGVSAKPERPASIYRAPITKP